MNVAEQLRLSQPRIEFSDLIGSDRCNKEVCDDPFPDELPASVSNSCPGDRVVHADHWQGELDTPEPFSPSDADVDEMARWCEWCDRNEEIARDARLDEAEAESHARYGL